MSHLDTAALFDALAGKETRDARDHLTMCARCRDELDEWQGHVALLRELEAEEVDASEEHQLRVLFRQLGPSPRRRRWLARLVSPSPDALQAEGVRGALAPTLSQYSTGEVTLIVQVSPVPKDRRFNVHGRVVTGDLGRTEGSLIVLSSAAGFGHMLQPDPLGEFHFAAVPAGRYRMTWAFADGHVDVEDLVIGETKEAPDD